MPTERLWTTCWMVTDSAKKKKNEDGGTAKDGLTVFNRAFSLLSQVGIGRKIMIVVAFYVAAPQNKNEVTSLEDR